MTTTASTAGTPTTFPLATFFDPATRLTHDVRLFARVPRSFTHLESVFTVAADGSVLVAGRFEGTDGFEWFDVDGLTFTIDPRGIRDAIDFEFLASPRHRYVLGIEDPSWVFDADHCLTCADYLRHGDGVALCGRCADRPAEERIREVLDMAAMEAEADEWQGTQHEGMHPSDCEPDHVTDDDLGIFHDDDGNLLLFAADLTDTIAAARKVAAASFIDDDGQAFDATTGEFICSTTTTKKGS